MSKALKGVSVVIPTGGNRRLHLLDATLAGMRRSHGIKQIILAEFGNRPCAMELARRWQADHIFSRDQGPFNRSRALNMGSQFASQELVLWCDGDAIFDAQFIPRAEAEIRRRKLDFLLPFSTIHALGEGDTEAVIAGQRDPETCPNHGYYGSRHPGFMGIVTAQFLQKYGGMPEAFHGWGCEDEAWVHKVKILGAVGWSQCAEQKAWHLFHPQSTRDLSNIDGNALLLRKMLSIEEPAEMMRAFPDETRGAPPWQRSNRIAFVTIDKSRAQTVARLANSWARRMRGTYAVTPRMVRLDPAQIEKFSPRADIDLFVIFARSRTATELMLERLQGQSAIVVINAKTSACDRARPLLQDQQSHWLLPRTDQQAERWHREDSRIWHRGWENGEGRGQPVPVLAQLLGLALGTNKRWSIKIELDRAALPTGALDRSPFWYVAVHDAEGNELARHDAEMDELAALAATHSDKFLLHRNIPAVQRPANWIVQPTDRHRNWLERIEGRVSDAVVRGVEA